VNVMGVTFVLPYAGVGECRQAVAGVPGDDILFYGHDDALMLVRGFLDREERDEHTVSRATPIIVFSAPPGAGKTALLRELKRLLEQNAPCAWIDCKNLHGKAKELPAYLAFELSRRCGRYRSLRFPRLVAGLIAIEASLKGCRADRERAKSRIRHKLEEHRNTAALLQAAFGEALDAGTDVMGGTPPTVVQAAIAFIRRFGPRLVLSGMVATRHGRRIILGEGQDWYSHQDRGLGRDALDVLVDLNQWARSESRQDQDEAADLLWKAFFADFDAAFRHRRAIDWTFNCLVLLDNADKLVGEEVLEKRIAAWGGTNPLTVVAASRGVLAEQVVPRGTEITPLADASYDGWRARHGRSWYAVALPDLAADDVSAMVSRLEGLPAGARRGGIAAAIYRYTGGHAAAVRALVAAIAKAPDIARPDADETFDLARLIDDQADSLLADLLKGVPAKVVKDLVTCSAAKNLEEAKLLGTQSGTLNWTRGEDAEVFSAAFWVPRGADRLLHPLLRRLLLRRLAVRTAAEAMNWAAVHGRLRDIGDQVGALYHTLALGAAREVGHQLAAALPEMDTEAWLKLLEAVTDAPNCLDQEVKSTEGVAELAGRPAPGDLQADAAQVTAAMWINADPLSDRHRSGLRHEIDGGLHRIARFARAPDVLHRYADKKYGAGAILSSDDERAARPEKGVSFVPPPSRRGVRRARARRVLAASSAVVVAAGIAACSYALASGGPAGPVSCAPTQGLFRVFVDDGECVGVTDGSYDFDPGSSADQRNIAAVERLIAGQNGWVTTNYKSDYVTVALLTPLTEPAPGATPSDVTLSRIDDELRGAHLAVYYANHETGLLPKIRLLLANEGSSEQGWQADWDQLRQLTSSPGQLVAVTGMGISVQQTVKAARAIGGAGIAMFGAVTTADSLDGTTSPYLAQVVPGVSDEVQALSRYLRKPSRAVLIYDEQATDLYTERLRADFTGTYGASIGEDEIPYAPSNSDSNLFKKIAEDVCYTPQQPPLVFYAGRDSVFDQLVIQLQEEGDCAGQKLTIVTGGDADGLPVSSTLSDAGGAQVSIIYADIENGAAITPAFRGDYQAWLGKADDAGMTDPWMLATYNATAAAASAIAEAAGPPQPAQVSAGQVDVWVDQLNGPAAVTGATGPFSIGYHGDLDNPQIPIAEMTDGQRTTLVTETVP